MKPKNSWQSDARAQKIAIGATPGVARDVHRARRCRADAARAGRLFRPTPYGVAEMRWNLDPKTDDADSIDLPDSDDFNLAHRGASLYPVTRIDFPVMGAEEFQRIWGYVGPIGEPPAAENDTAGFRPDVACKSPFRIADFRDSPAKARWAFARIRAYSATVSTHKTQAATNTSDPRVFRSGRI